MEAVRVVDPLTASNVQQYVDSFPSDNFGNILTGIQTSLGRQLSRDEKGFISTALRSRRMKEASIYRETDSIYLHSGDDSVTGSEDIQSFSNVLIVTAYSDDYTIGTLCEKVNRSYATLHGYEFHSEVLPLDEMSVAIAPKKHCAWYKIALLKKLFADVDQLRAKKIQYIMWVDADAIIVDHTIKLADIVSRCGSRDLIIAEDMNTGCQLNSGVFMLRTTRWSRDLLNDVWNCAKYNDRTFYEQSTMVRVLNTKKEDLDSVTPFHSYLPNAYTGVKLFPHTAVLPLAEFNSNRGILCNDVKAYESYVLSVQNGSAPVDATQSSTQYPVQTLALPDGHNISDDTDHTTLVNAAERVPRKGQGKLAVPSECYQTSGNFCTLCQRTVGSNHKRTEGSVINANPSLFVFHPAGMPDKLTLLYAALYKYKVPYNLAADILRAQSATTSSGDMQDSSVVAQRVIAPLRLVRGKLGQIPQADQHHLLCRLSKQV